MHRLCAVVLVDVVLTLTRIIASFDCMDSKAGEKVPRPLAIGETVHGSTKPGEVVHFDYLRVGASGPLGDDGLDENEGGRYIPAMMDGTSK